MSLFHRHRWLITASQPMTTSYRGVGVGHITVVLMACECGATETKDLDGHWPAGTFVPGQPIKKWS